MKPNKPGKNKWKDKNLVFKIVKERKQQESSGFLSCICYAGFKLTFYLLLSLLADCINRHYIQGKICKLTL